MRIRRKTGLWPPITCFTYDELEHAWAFLMRAFDLRWEDWWLGRRCDRYRHREYRQSERRLIQ